jgi:hypothetical protein
MHGVSVHVVEQQVPIMLEVQEAARKSCDVSSKELLK